MSDTPVVRLFPADRTGCGFYRMMEPGRVTTELSSDVKIETCFEDDDEGALTIQLIGRLGNARVVGVDHPNCDVVVLQRPATRELAETIPLLQRHGVAVVAEYDDDFDSVPRNNAAWAAYDPVRSPLSNKVWAKLCSQLADLVIVSTAALAKRYGEHGHAMVIPNYVPQWYLDVELPDPTTQRGVFGWAGNPMTHQDDLTVIGRAVRELTDAGYHFKTIGHPRTLKMLRVPTESATVLPWVELDQLPAAVAELNVGIVPLADNTFNRSKSWIKGLEYAALGVPFVASPSPEYQQLAMLGAGDLVQSRTTSTAQWRAALLRYLDDDVYRRLRAEEGRIVAAELTYEKNGERWLQAWSTALTIRRAT